MGREQEKNDSLENDVQRALIPVSPTKSCSPQKPVGFVPQNMLTAAIKALVLIL